MTPPSRVALARRLVPIAFVGLLLSAYALWDAEHARSGAALPEISASLTELRQQFDRDAGHTRMVVILDPT